MPEKSLLRFGAVSLILGAVILQVAGALHPESIRILTPSEHLADIAQSSGWFLDHFSFIIAFLFIIAGTFTISKSLHGDKAHGWAQLAFNFTLLAGGFVTVFFTLDGMAFKMLADLYAAASGADQQILLGVGAFVGITERIFFSVWTFLAFGVAPLFWSAAMMKNSLYKKWFSYLPLVSGALGVIVGLLNAFKGFSMSYLPGFYISIVLFNIWLIIMGVSLWKKSSTIQTM